MPEIPDLSRFAKDGAESDGKVHLTDEEKEALAAMATEEDKAAAPPQDDTRQSVEVITAYVVAITPAGDVRVVAYDGPGLTLQRPFGAVDLLASSAYVQADIQSTLAAQKTQQALMMAAAAAQEQAARAQVQQQIARGGLGFPKGR